MNALGQRIAGLITGQGPISIADFMALSLHDPEYGAYASRDPIGAGGDYVTSPEVSQTFGEMCGLWVIQTWHNLGRPARPLLVELGPGRGTLMRDVLRTINSAMRKFLEDCEVVLVEASPVLKSEQEKVLANAPVKVNWIPTLDALETDRPVFVLANEFFDCMPIRQYVKTVEGWAEKMIVVRDGNLALGLKRVHEPEKVLPPAAADAPEDGVLETSPAAVAIIDDLARMIAQNNGAALIFDYGYDAPTYKETLQALKRHKYADALSAPGDSDLSAHVDFAALIAAARQAGAIASGPVEQGDFLADLGIEVRAQRLVMANPQKAKDIVAGVTRLIDPKEMGALFKVIALTKPDAPLPPGFADKAQDSDS